MKAVAFLTVLFVACSAGCRKKTSESSSERSATYTSPSGRFAFKAPVGWRAKENQNTAPTTTLFGPPEGKEAFTQSVRVTLYPKDVYASPAAYYAGVRASGAAASPTRERRSGEANALEFDVIRAVTEHHGTQTEYAERYFALPHAGGVLVAVWTRPSASASASQTFEDVTATLSAR